MFFSISYTIIFWPFTWVVWLLNTFLYFDQSLWNVLDFNLARDTLFVWQYSRYTCSRLDILERLGLSLLTLIYFGCYLLVLLSDKIADEIYLDLLIVFTVSSVLVLWEALDLSNYTPLFDSLLIDLSFYFEMLGIFLFRLWRQFYFFHVMSDGFLHHIRFCLYIIDTFFDNLVCSSDQWLFGRHDLGARYFLFGFLKNRSNFIG